jgi:hypothetical protein
MDVADFAASLVVESTRSDGSCDVVTAHAEVTPRVGKDSLREKNMEGFLQSTFSTQSPTSTTNTRMTKTAATRTRAGTTIMETTSREGLVGSVAADEV